MRADAEDVARLYAELRNLGILKGFLADRREQRAFSSIEDTIFGF